MNLRKTAAPASEPVTLEQVKDHCEVDYNDKNDLLTSFRDSAVALVEKRAGIALVRQDYRLELTCWPYLPIEFPISPVRDVTAVKYIDEVGGEQSISAADYRWIVEKGRAKLWFLSGFGRPSLQRERPDSIRIEFEAGYDDPNETGGGDDPELAFPPQARNIVLMLTSFWFNNRDAVVVGSGEPKILPMGVEALLSDLKVYR